MAAALVGVVLLAACAVTNPVTPAAATAPSSAPAQSTTPAPAPPTFTSLTYAFDVRPLAGMTSTDIRSGTDYQQIEVYSTAPTPMPVAWVLAYPPGGFRPARPAGAVDVQIGGHPGFTGIVPATGPGMTSVTDGPGLDAVAWEYAPGAWVVVQTAGPQQLGVVPASPLLIAGAVTFSGTHPVPVPVTFGYLPAGLTPSSITSTVQGPTRSTVVDFGSQQRGLLGMSVEIGSGEPGFSPGAHRGSPIALGGFTGYYDQACSSIYLVGKGVYVAITSTGHLNGNCQPPADATAPSLSTLTQVLHGLSFAPNQTDPTTWLPATEAIPTR
jgi:hypothetical protein